jgi:hypothetical protein
MSLTAEAIQKIMEKVLAEQPAPTEPRRMPDVHKICTDLDLMLRRIWTALDIPTPPPPGPPWTWRQENGKWV